MINLPSETKTKIIVFIGGFFAAVGFITFLVAMYIAATGNNVICN